MRKTIKLAALGLALPLTALTQIPEKAQFEVASIKMNAPEVGFHFAADAISGGPGTSDPGMFRCVKCSLSTLIVKAFQLQPYQFPGRAALAGNTYDIAAKVPVGTTEEEFSVMLQNLLKDRFGLTWHFQEKQMKGYHLVVAKSGPKLKQSVDPSLASPPDQRRAGGGESHNHSGVIAFGTSASYRANNRTTADLARVLSDQLGIPIDDETGLTGKYDISLRWSGPAAQRVNSLQGHSEGDAAGGAWHAGRDGGGAPSGSANESSAPTLFDALQQELGLKLVPAEQTKARLFVIDKVAPRPTEN